MSEAGVRQASVAAAIARSGLESLANRLIALDPDSLRRCAELAGKTVDIRVEGLDLGLRLGFDAAGLRIGAIDEAQAADTLISGTPFALFGMAAGKGPGALFSGEVRMQGDTLTGKRLHRLLAALDIDWEEQLSRIAGDLVAHRTLLLFRDLGQWRRRSAESLALDLGEYLQEETGLLAGRAEVEQLVDAIDDFAQGVDRLEARIRLLAASR